MGEIAMLLGTVSFGGSEMEPIFAGIVPVAGSSPPWFLVLVVGLAFLFIWKKSVENSDTGTATGFSPTFPSEIETPVATTEVDTAVTTAGESVIIDEPCNVEIPVRETVLADGRSEDEKAIHTQIEQMIADGANLQEIADETGLPIGEIEVISGLQQRRSPESA